MTDFLNNLWVAVSTPNPELIKIIYTFVNFLGNSFNFVYVKINF